MANEKHIFIGKAAHKLGCNNAVFTAADGYNINFGAVKAAAYAFTAALRNDFNKVFIIRINPVSVEKFAQTAEPQLFEPLAFFIGKSAA